jgi:hypothetical protein
MVSLLLGKAQVMQSADLSEAIVMDANLVIIHANPPDRSRKESLCLGGELALFLQGWDEGACNLLKKQCVVGLTQANAQIPQGVQRITVLLYHPQPLFYGVQLGRLAIALLNNAIGAPLNVASRGRIAVRMFHLLTS